ncbi:MAG: prenyltransferase/squalene oxidase repeat-containing protein [Promethearchaeota archaeon]
MNENKLGLIFKIQKNFGLARKKLFGTIIILATLLSATLGSFNIIIGYNNQDLNYNISKIQDNENFISDLGDPLNRISASTGEHIVNISDLIKPENLEANINFNTESITVLRDQILNMLNTGEFFDGVWVPNLRSTYYAVKILDILGNISRINVDYIANFVLSCYNDTIHLFEDKNTFEWEHIPLQESKIKFGYSKIEATAYAILILDIIDRLFLLNQTEQDSIYANLILAIDEENGGFSDRTDYNPPYNSSETASLTTSYYCYYAILALKGSTGLLAFQRVQLRNFIIGLQYLEQSMKRGNFIESQYFSEINSMFQTYMGIKLLQELNGVDDINKTYFQEWIDRLWDSFYEGECLNIHDAMFLYGGSAAGSAIAIYAVQATGINPNQFDASKAESFIYSQFNWQLGYWKYNYDANLYFLENTFFIVQALSDSGINLSSSMKQKICEGLNDFKADIYENNISKTGFTKFPKIYGNLERIYNYIKFMDKYGYIDYISASQKDQIYQFVKDCYYENISGGEDSFAINPIIAQNEYKYLLQHGWGFPLDWSYYYSNIGSTGSHGLPLTYMALYILNAIGKLDDFHAEKNILQLKDAILQCQANTGEFYAINNPAIISPRYLSLNNAWFAVNSLKIIDDLLGTDYRYYINVYSLKSSFESNFYEINNTGIFKDPYAITANENNEAINLELTLAILDVESLYQFWNIEPQYKEKISAYIAASSKYPSFYNIKNMYKNIDKTKLTSNEINEIIQIQVLLIVLNSLLNASNLMIDISDLCSFIPNYFGYNYTNIIPQNIINPFWDILFQFYDQSHFTSLYLINYENYYIGFSYEFRLIRPTIFDSNINQCYMNYQVQNNQGILPAQSINYDVDDDNYQILNPQSFTFDYYPNFIIRIQVINASYNKIDLKIPTMLNYAVELEGINELANLTEQKLYNYTIGSYYLDEYQRKSPLNISLKCYAEYQNGTLINFTENDGTLNLTHTQQNDINWNTIDIDLSSIADNGTLFIDFWDESFIIAGSIIGAPQQSQFSNYTQENIIHYVISIPIIINNLIPRTNQNDNIDNDNNTDNDNDNIANNKNNILNFIIIGAFLLPISIIGIKSISNTKRSNKQTQSEAFIKKYNKNLKANKQINKGIAKNTKKNNKKNKNNKNSIISKSNKSKIKSNNKIEGNINDDYNNNEYDNTQIITDKNKTDLNDTNIAYETVDKDVIDFDEYTNNFIQQNKHTKINKEPQISLSELKKSNNENVKVSAIVLEQYQGNCEQANSLEDELLKLFTTLDET